MKEMKNKENKMCKKQCSAERRVANWLRFALPNVVCQVLYSVMLERSEASKKEILRSSG
ncbi:putative membrane protein [Dysgonomonas hofstadii]|uniref:Putative membrane protein n=1 Tax=Dysgonomonas hofstadii TaxID=637886 RepID=A0A840CT20_9BACT|nr:putative membrane protein [Dysgonomonas hofstadii]